jgi:dTDP-4-dehydrorhamnose reductase
MKPAAGIWLTGAEGMLGKQLAAEFAARGRAFHASDRDVDIRDPRALREFSRGKNIGWIINCAAYTAVDRAEDEAELALAINAGGVENLARLAGDLGATLVHFSTDYVFAGDQPQPYRESDAPRPLSRYGWSKRQGEERLAAGTSAFFLFRISWLYGVFGPNFVHTMLKAFREREMVRVVNDQFGSPTYAATLAANIVDLVEAGCERYGVYHYCDRGVISWWDFAVAIQDVALAKGLLGKKIPIQAISTSAFSSRATRPLHAVLDSGKAVRELGFQVRPWLSNLEYFLAEKECLVGGRP